MKQTNQEVLCFCCSQFGLDLGSGERAPHRFRYLQTQPHWKKTPASPPAPPQRPGRVSGVAGPCLFRLPSSGNWDSAPRWHCAWLRLRLRCPGARLPLVVSETGPSQVPGLLSLSLCSLLLCIFMSISYVPGLGRATGATSLAQTWEMWSHKPHTQRSKLRLAVREAALMTPCCTMRWPEEWSWRGQAGQSHQHLASGSRRAKQETKFECQQHRLRPACKPKDGEAGAQPSTAQKLGGMLIHERAGVFQEPG
ncbi:uncharacterized protein CCDC197 isoform X5 [Fukomys damarensis]|uniref:uncharacterized protein CCDC197 isoform X5 n=1 Tax=Fukomys damarensis TaxID=885580 RepID=UPI00053F71F0|nr:uncharacterized protein CCDC197 isoform X5 [Fukomys damarensis]XP_010607494.1 uncharacterized protein CCDC197 isoform X5 [Fukomys damarensis]XP_010607495.1 uncharacterized protein CCDC197 isoform X5 [Fukomys damarensis]XP_019060804.1 uncharacterized protein CCDC197 isoform X5 [Fukomys damarensis]